MQKLITERYAILNFKGAGSEDEDTTEIIFHFDCNMDQTSCQVDHHNTSYLNNIKYGTGILYRGIYRMPVP